MGKSLYRINLYVGIVSGVITILSAIIAAIFQSPFVALVIFLSWLSIFSVSLLLIIYSQFKKYLAVSNSGDHRVMFSHLSYVGLTRETGVYNALKCIQCKHFFLETFKYEFKWTGDEEPRVDSYLQSLVKPIKYTHTLNSPDVATLKLKTPIYFNETAMIHLRLEVTDTSHKALPVLVARMPEHSHDVHFLCQLNYRHSNNQAVLEKKNTVNEFLDDKWQLIQFVPLINNRYEHILDKPETGYHYRLRWEW